MSQLLSVRIITLWKKDPCTILYCRQTTSRQCPTAMFNLEPSWAVSRRKRRHMEYHMWTTPEVRTVHVHVNPKLSKQWGVLKPSAYTYTFICSSYQLERFFHYANYELCEVLFKCLPFICLVPVPVFSSSGQQADELLSWRVVRRPSSGVRCPSSVHISRKLLLLPHFLSNFDSVWYVW